MAVGEQKKGPAGCNFYANTQGSIIRMCDLPSTLGEYKAKHIRQNACFFVTIQHKTPQSKGCNNISSTFLPCGAGASPGTQALFQVFLRETLDTVPDFELLCIAKLNFLMNNLNKALGDISSIRRQMARSTEFRGYGPATLAATGIFAIIAAFGQAIWLPAPSKSLPAYLATWVSTAILSDALIATQMLAR